MTISNLMIMIVLPKCINRWESRWVQLKRIGLLAIYSQRGKHGAKHYNVVIIRHRKENLKFRTPEKEALPSAEEWGMYGWTYQNEESAHKKFETLLDQGKDKKRQKNND